MTNNLSVIERRVAKVGGIYGDTILPLPSAPSPYSCAIDLLPLCKELSLSQAFLLDHGSDVEHAKVPFQRWVVDSPRIDVFLPRLPPFPFLC